LKRLGVFGGTFDPVHYGHLKPAQKVLATFALDALVFVPAAIPPHKLTEPVSSFAHRFAMLALAAAPHEGFVLSDLEQRRGGPSYTVDTLREVREAWRAETLFFVLGSDSLAQITTWHRWETLVELAHLVVLRRDPWWGAELERHVPALFRPRLRLVEATTGAGLAGNEMSSGCIFLLEHQPYPISATAVRQRLRAGLDASELVPPEVQRYAVRNRLYHHGERVD